MNAAPRIHFHLIKSILSLKKRMRIYQNDLQNTKICRWNRMKRANTMMVHVEINNFTQNSLNLVLKRCIANIKLV